MKQVTAGEKQMCIKWIENRLESAVGKNRPMKFCLRDMSDNWQKLKWVV